MRKRFSIGLIFSLVFMALIGFEITPVSAARGSSWGIQVIDNVGNVGRFTSIALDQTGNPHISYCDWSNNDLKYASWTGTKWNTSVVDSTGNVGWYTSLALDSEGYPHISYYDLTNEDLKYAMWDGSSWVKQTVDSSGNVGQYSSIALDSGGYPHISYYCETNGNLKYACWTGDNWAIKTVDTEGYVGQYSSIALDSQGRPRIGYYDKTNHDLNYARWTGETWSISVVDSAGQVGEYVSMVLDNRDYPHMSYYDATNGALKYACWVGNKWEISTVDNAGNVGQYTSIALSSQNYPNISYYDLTNSALKYARWTGSRWNISTVDDTGNVGQYTSIVLDPYGYFQISYYDLDNGDLRYARSSPPVLSSGTVSPSSGIWGTKFTYEVTYTDAEGDAPFYVKVYIDGTAHIMFRISGSTYKEGVLYRYIWSTTSADVGSHSYYFETSDGVSIVRHPQTGSYTGPTVSKKSTSITCGVDNATPLIEQEIRFSGYLRDQYGVGLGGRTVHLYMDGFDTGLSTVTAENGYYTILATTSSTPGTYSFTARFGGDETFLSSESSAVSVTVEARTYRIFGYVKCGDNPVENAEVVLNGHSTITDENGYYEFSGLEGNTSYMIDVRANGCQTYRGPVFVGYADEMFNVILITIEEANLWQIPAAIIVIILVVGAEVMIVYHARKQTVLQ